MFNIAIVAPSNLPIPSVKGGAIETLIDHFIKENERKNKFSITIISSFNEEAFQESIKFQHTKFHYIKQNTKNNYPLLTRIINKIFRTKITFKSPFNKALVKFFKKNSFDLVIVEGNDLYLDLLYNVIPRQKLWFHIHYNVFNHYSPKLTKRINRCSKIISVSNFIKNEIQRNYSFENIEIIKNCVDLNNFKKKYTVDEINLTKKKYKIDNEIVILFTGRIVKEKGVIELLQAYMDVQTKKKTKLILAGSFGHKFGNGNVKDSFYQEIMQLIQPIKDKVIFTGFIPNNKLHQLYAIAHISVVPSQCDEAAPLTVIEGRVSGIPLIVSNSGGIPEYVNEKCAITIPRGNDFTTKLKEALSLLIENDEKRNEMKLYNEQNYFHFSSSRYFQEFSDIILKELIL